MTLEDSYFESTLLGVWDYLDSNTNIAGYERYTIKYEPAHEIMVLIIYLLEIRSFYMCDTGKTSLHVSELHTVETELKVTQSALDVHMGCTPFVKD